MSKRYKNLLSPLRIGDVILKNRLMTPNAMPHFLQGPETFPAEGTRAHITGMAKNGCAVIVMGDWSNYPDQRKGPDDLDFTHFAAWDFTDPAVQNYLSMMADEVHMFGSKLILCFDMEFPEGYTLHGTRMGPPRPGPEPQILPREMMPQVKENFVKRCEFFRNLGFDGFGCRLDMVMNTKNSRRDDEYNGSPLNRVKFYLECFAEVKRRMPKFLIEVGLAGEQPMGYTGDVAAGYTLEDTIEFCKAAEGVVDILEIREKDMTKSHPTGYTCVRGEYNTVDYAAAIKAAGCKIITAPLGGFQDPEYMEAALRAGKCDMFGMARAFFADFEFGKKLYAGQGEDITPCIKCNRCHGTIKTPHDPWVSVCSVNPLFGLQSYIHRLTEAPGEPKKVAVVGGGPAGMRAALFAAQRGHKVTLFEMSDYLGGQLKHAESFAFKWPIKDYRDWLVREIGKAGVEVRMNTRATPDMIEAGGFDVVYAATGAEAQLPGSIKGLRDESGKALYPTCVDVFGKEAELGHNVVIIGASEVGIETAMYLCQNGHEVTMLTRQGEIGHDCSKLHYVTMSWVKPDGNGLGHMAPAWEQYEDVLHGIVNVSTKSVQGNVVTYVDAEGAEHQIKADSVVICGGIKPRMDEAMEFASSADRFFIIGDCNGNCGSLQKCNRDAWANTQLI